jgi:thiol-disulfide isomerase/thioredoxin
LQHLGSDNASKLDGKDAPPLRVARWINSGPLDWQRLRGKVVLVEFWGTWCPPCRLTVPALCRLYQFYKPAGLEVIAVHTSTEKPEEVRKFADEFHVPYPIGIDTPQESEGGASAAAFGVQGYPTAFLVDHTGKVHPIERGRLTEAVVRLLKQAGAKDLKPIDIEYPRMSDEMYKAVRASFLEQVKQAPAAGKIRGTLTDGRGAPLGGAQVRARLRFSMLGSSIPGGYTLIHYPQRFNAVAGADGTFALPGLVKGTYELEISAPGKAILDRKVTLEPSPGPVTLNAILTQGDTITGRVRDEMGRPVANARVVARHRHFDLNNLDTFTTGQLPPPAAADTAGRFRLGRPYTGAYTCDITAPGFEKGMLERVSAGSTDIEITLKRSRLAP